MKTLFLIVSMLSLFSTPGLSQKKPELSAQASTRPFGLSSFTLTGTYAEDGHGQLKMSAKAQRNCFDFVSESEVPCVRRWDLIYGNMRAGDEWDWFFVPASDDVRTRLVSLGKKEWNQIKSLPEIEALPKLKPGEKRVARVDASGADGAPGCPGAPGANGRNGDGTVTSTRNDQPPCREPAVNAPAKKPVTTNELFVKAVKGEMYVLRVMDENFDFYVLLRVDDIVRGRTARISWKKLEAL
jgi:hypothetical protein